MPIADDEVRRAAGAIPGWTTVEELETLHRVALRAGERFRPLTVVEIGSYEGRSTVALALGIRGLGHGRVHAIDPHGEELDHFEAFLKNIAQAGVDDLVEPLRMTSEAARWRFDEGSVHVLFVDGSHEYHVVAYDLFDWTPALAIGATVAVNDPFWPGVNRALRERAALPGSPFRRPRFVSNTVFFDYRPDLPWTATDAREHRRLRAMLKVGPWVRGPERDREGSEGPSHGWRRAAGRAIDRVLSSLVPDLAAPRTELHPDAGFALQKVIQGAIRDRMAQAAVHTDPRVRLLLETPSGVVQREGAEARAFLSEVAGRLFPGPDTADWRSSIHGQRPQLEFWGTSAGHPVHVIVRAELTDLRIAALHIATDAPLDLGD